ncbi:MAG: S8 family serine peptidase [Thermoanaerobaculales bacterium]|nr:S8 family serine peptidase [Thermoanaerobaculales bacterium]
MMRVQNLFFTNTIVTAPLSLSAAPVHTATLEVPMRCFMFFLVIALVPALTPPAAANDRPATSAPPNPSQVASTNRNPVHPGLSPLLNQLYASRFAPSFVGDRRGLDHLVKSGDSVEIVVEAYPAAVEATTQSLRRLGVRPTSSYRQLLFATVPIARLPMIAGSDGVSRVRTPYRSEPHAMSQGVALHNADAMHGDGFSGLGVKIGVLDCGGFSGYQGLLGSDLPASVTVWQGGADPVGPDVHGAGCAEIVHDMAPDAELFFAHDDTEADYYAAVDWFIAQGVDVISYSCGWTNPFPYDGSGAPYNMVNAKVEEARDAGILFVISAGNSADNDNYQGVYEQIQGYPWHSFDGDWSNGVFSWSGSAYYVVLTWDDWPADPLSSGATQDYNLLLWYWDGTEWIVVASSENPQNGVPGQLPYEELEFNPPLDEWYYLAIQKINTTRDCYLNLKKSANGGFIHYNATQSLTAPADSPAALTVGAIHWSSLAREPFSSQGRTLGPGGTQLGGLLRPDLVAADAVDTVTSGLSDGAGWPDGTGFFGTSASCPHVAGAAALLLSANPDMDADALASGLRALAVDMGPPGPDTMFGHGRLFVDGTIIFADGFESGDTGAWQ